MTHTYTIILDPDTDEGGYAVYVPALPGCITQGETVDECIERAKEAIAGYIYSLEAHGEAVPVETERPQAITLAVDLPATRNARVRQAHPAGHDSL